MKRGRGAPMVQEPLPLLTRAESARCKGQLAARRGQGPETCPYVRPTYRIAWFEGWAQSAAPIVRAAMSEAGSRMVCRA